MKQKLFIGFSIDRDVGGVLMRGEEVSSIQQLQNGEWLIISVDGCAYDFVDVHVIEGDFVVRDPKPSDSKT